MVAVLCALLTSAVQGQEMDDPARLAGVGSVSLRVSAVWDELITTSAGGATAGQFEEALDSGLRAALADAERGPDVAADAPGTLRCHVDTFYDRGLIVYSVIASYERPDADGVSVAAWLRSWVGSYTAQQMHVIWTLADQCADAFLEAWGQANG